MPIVYVPAPLRELTGGAAQVETQGTTVLEVIDALEMVYPGIKERLCLGDKLNPALQVSIDHTMTARGLRTKVQPGSEVHFLPVLGGG